MRKRSMTHSRSWLATAAAFSLLFGIELPDPNLTGEHFPLPTDPMVAAADRALDGDTLAQPATGCLQERSCGPVVYE
jgi:hypothetical protein